MNDCDNSLFEIKCLSLKNDLKLEDMFNSGKYDIVFESGALILKSNRHRGYYSVHCIYKFNLQIKRVVQNNLTL